MVLWVETIGVVENESLKLQKYVEEVLVEKTDDDEVLGLFAAVESGKEGFSPMVVSVLLDQKSCKMQLDTRATVSILPKTLAVWPTFYSVAFT